MLSDLEDVMTQRVMTTGGYPTKMPDAGQIAEDVTDSVKGMKVDVSQITGISSPVSDVLQAKTAQDIRDAAGIQESQIAVKGDPGPENVLSIGDVETLTPGEPGKVTITGDSPEQVVNFWLPQAEADQISISAGEVKTLSYGESASASITGDHPDYLVNFAIPAGKNADDVILSAGSIEMLPNGSEPQINVEGSYPDFTISIKIPAPANGLTPENPSITTGTVKTLQAGSNATAQISGSYPNFKVDFGIPAGQDAQTNKLTVGSVTTLSSSSKATVEITGQTPNYIVNFGIPSGAPGVNATTTTNATATTPGLMSGDDKKKLDGLSATPTPVFNIIASGGRPVGTAFTVDANRNARVSYTISYTLTATLTVGQTLQIVATVDGKEVARMADGILLGLAGNLQKTKSFSFDVPAGKSVLLTKTGTSSIVATVISGQEVLY